MNFSKIHKKQTGHSLKSEQVKGTKDEFKGKSKAQILADGKAHDAKHSMAKKMKPVTNMSDKYKRSLSRDGQLALTAKRLKTSRYDEFGREKNR